MKETELIDLALQSLSRFKSGEIPLHELSNELQTVLDLLHDSRTKPWVSEFNRLHTHIETVNAIRLDEEHEGADKDQDSRLMDTISSLESLLRDEQGN